ncbi:cyclic pyranopterin phosphate synthase [Oikeobacillus pervagus]|uniref:GTP 3',8-cyclase n=1 Tax=Oikeobacillus pervagus TaxID=1325931 RepID=A0AAJ1WKB9_9BACI|nr:GTP 3',8-cyclase MoaA [Oikeobacillus pervagus]MDQ0216433.1 cyclic pyranopterin phosphate synthase [Oikeobacillus pervagus]
MTDKIFDKLQRPLRDLRISVTDRCNFRCQYCMPAEIFGKDFAFLPKSEVLTFEEIERVAIIFRDLGVKKIRITGGEPFMRKDLPQLLKRLSRIEGIDDIGLTTNGLLLPKYSSEIFSAGIKRANVSLDAIDNEIFTKMNGRGVRSEAVIKGIDAALAAGLKVKVNMVVQKGVNDCEIIPMAKLCREKRVSLRFIEFMDVGNTNGWNWDQVMSKKEIFQLLSQHFEMKPVDPSYFGEVAKRYKYNDTGTEVGFITSVSESFCSSCTRIRLSADGKLFTCLFANDGFDLRQLMRSNASDVMIKEKMIQIWNHREDQYSSERQSKGTRKKSKIEMSYIGG